MLRLFNSEHFNYSSKNWQIKCSKIQLPNSTLTKQKGYGGYGFEINVQTKHVGNIFVQLYSSTRKYTTKVDKKGTCLIIPEKNTLKGCEIKIFTLQSKRT